MKIFYKISSHQLNFIIFQLAKQLRITLYGIINWMVTVSLCMNFTWNHLFNSQVFYSTWNYQPNNLISLCIILHGTIYWIVKDKKGIDSSPDPFRGVLISNRQLIQGLGSGSQDYCWGKIVPWDTIVIGYVKLSHGWPMVMYLHSFTSRYVWSLISSYFVTNSVTLARLKYW